MKDFYNEIILCFTKEEVPFCRYDLKFIYFKYETFLNPSEDDLFDLLHEIGHIITNNHSMKRCEEEFYATQWALDNMGKYNVTIGNERINDFQKYIWKWREQAIKRNAKKVPTKEQLTLIA